MHSTFAFPQLTVQLERERDEKEKALVGKVSLERTLATSRNECDASVSQFVLVYWHHKFCLFVCLFCSGLILCNCILLTINLLMCLASNTR
jgi:hypothetical protein